MHEAWPALAVVLLVATVGAQPLPVVVIGDSLDEQATALVEAPDTGYCLAGWTSSLGLNGLSRILIVRTDPLGVPVWARVSVGENDDEAYSMVRTHDNCYAVTGWTASYGLGIPSRNVFAMKLTMAGNLLWAWAYGGMGDDEAYSIWETMDNGFIIAGFTNGFGPPPYPNILVIKISAGGVFQWGRVYWCSPNHVCDEALAVVQTPDTGYAVVGRANTTGPTQLDPFVLKLNQTGVIQWAQTAPGPDDEDEGHSVAVDRQGNILVAGWTRSYGTNPYNADDIFVAQFALPGILIWSNTYGWPDGKEMVLDDRSLVPTADAGCAVCGLTTSVGPQVPNPNFLVFKLHISGGVQWARSHPSPADTGLGWSEVALPMIQEGYGGYAIAGWSNSYPYLGGTADDNFHLLTLDQNGNRPVCAERQTPILDSMPWTPIRMEDSVVYIDMDSMPMIPAPVRYQPICVMPGTKERGEVPASRPAYGLSAPRSPVSAGKVSLAYSVPVPGAGRLLVTDPSGRAVRSRPVRIASRGSVDVDLRGLGAGVYLVRLDAPGFSDTKKLVIER